MMRLKFSSIRDVHLMLDLDQLLGKEFLFEVSLERF